MRGLQKSKRVSWPSDVNLCQVKRNVLMESHWFIAFFIYEYLFGFIVKD